MTHLSNEVNYQCIGCGTQIQTNDKDKIGYLPQSALEKGIEKGEFYCQRCFKLRHYNELQDLEISDDIFLEKLSNIANTNALVVNVIDIFDIEGSLIYGLPRFIGNQPFVVVANKFDLLPKSTKASRVRDWIRQLLNQNGLYPEDVLLTVATKQNSLNDLIKVIERAIKKRDIYIVGVTNVGKSSLMNQLIAYYGGDKEIITTSSHPGTTLDLIQIPLTPEHAIIDTPGIIHRSQLAHYLKPNELGKVIPIKPIKPKTYQLNPGQTIFLAGLGRVDFISGERAPFTYYVSNELYIHRTKTEKANEFYKQHKGKLLAPPSTQTIDEFPKLIPQRIRLKPNQDLVISGLGWLTTTKSVELEVWIPKGVGLAVRQAII